MRIRVNGEARDVREGTTLDELIAGLGLDRRYLVVELNGEALARDGSGTRVLAEDDELELVRPVAGG